MNDGNRYRVLGVELSPFSVKVRSWFRYKGIPHEWTGRMLGPDDKKYTKVPLVPVVVTPTGRRPSGLDADHRAARKGAPRAVDSPGGACCRIRIGNARGVRRRVGK